MQDLLRRRSIDVPGVQERRKGFAGRGSGVRRCSPNVPETALPAPDDAALEEERERFLREFKSQVLQVPVESAEVESGKSLGLQPGRKSIRARLSRLTYVRTAICACSSASICWKRRLHMDLIEATRVVYEAVWADPSDPSKTYQNAASAILTELRKRAGISVSVGAYPTTGPLGELGTEKSKN